MISSVQRLEIRFMGGSKNGQSMMLDDPLMPRLIVPKPVVRVPYVVEPDGYIHPTFETEEYVLATRIDGNGVERIYVEAELYRAELAAQERQSRAAEMEARVIRDFGEKPDPRTFAAQPFKVARIWRCGDPECQCEQAEVIGWMSAWTLDGEPAVFPPDGTFTLMHAFEPGTMRRLGCYVELWKGPFYTDGQVGAAADLVVLSEYLKAIGAEDIANDIVWPWARAARP